MISEDVNRCLLLTPSGAGAIGVIRLGGTRAARILETVFRPKSHSSASGSTRSFVSLFDDDRVRFGQLIDGDEVIDDVLVYRVSSGEPAYDISAHGGVRIIERILELLEREGAPLAADPDAPEQLWPSCNLIDTEAVEALGRAKTARGVRFLAWQRQHLPGEIERLASNVDKEPDRVNRRLREMAAAYPVVRAILDGVTIAIVGPPNSGKSTLFNQLVGRSAAIVSPTAGTTRDWVTECVDVEGVPITFTDTPGHRNADDALERLAILRGAAMGRQADMRLVLLDASLPLPRDVDEIFRSVGSGVSCVVVVNKTDLAAVWGIEELRDGIGQEWEDPIMISAQTGEGLDMLEQRIRGTLGLEDWVDEVPAIFTARQLEIVDRVLAELRGPSSDNGAGMLRELLFVRSGRYDDPAEAVP